MPSLARARRLAWVAVVAVFALPLVMLTVTGLLRRLGPPPLAEARSGARGTPLEVDMAAVARHGDVHKVPIPDEWMSGPGRARRPPSSLAVYIDGVPTSFTTQEPPERVLADGRAHAFYKWPRAQVVSVVCARSAPCGSAVILRGPGSWTQITRLARFRFVWLGVALAILIHARLARGALGRSTGAQTNAVTAVSALAIITWLAFGLAGTSVAPAFIAAPPVLMALWNLRRRMAPRAFSLCAEALAVSAAFVGLLSFLDRHGGGPLTWDELLYMDISLRPYAVAPFMNRYVHIYLQRLFFFWRGDALLGARLFWAFIVSGTTILVWVQARLLRSNRLTAAVAIVFFLAHRMLFEYSGVTYADFTAMLLGAVATTLAILARRRAEWLGPIAFLLGLVLYAAVRAKETGIVFILLLLVVVPLEPGREALRRWGRVLIVALVGAVAGAVVLVALNAVLLHDPSFGFRSSDWRGLSGFYHSPYQHEGRSWYAFLFGQPVTGVLFLLALLGVHTRSAARRFGASRSDMEIDPVLALIVIAMVVFLTVSMVGSIFEVHDRFILPILPLISLLAARALPLEEGSPQELFRVAAAAVTLALGVTLVPYPANMGWRPMTFHQAVVVPVAFSVLLTLLIIVPTARGTIRAFILAAALAVAVPPVSSAWTDLREEIVAHQSALRFYPLEHFRDHLRYETGTRLCVSSDIARRYRMLGREAGSTGWMLHLFFNRVAEGERILQEEAGMVVRQALEGECDVVFLSAQDWEAMERTPEAARLAERFTAEGEPSGRIVLLRR